jgi:hypothetical protein
VVGQEIQCAGGIAHHDGQHTRGLRIKRARVPDFFDPEQAAHNRTTRKRGHIGWLVQAQNAVDTHLYDLLSNLIFNAVYRVNNGIQNAGDGFLLRAVDRTACRTAMPAAAEISGHGRGVGAATCADADLKAAADACTKRAYELGKM